MKIYSNDKILFLDKVLPKDIEVFHTNKLTQKFLINNKIQALLIRSNEKITHSLIDGTAVEFIATATSGFDHIEEGISFYYAPGSNANSVAEYVVFAITKYIALKNLEVDKLTIGVIGYGNIGKLVARYAQELGIKVLINDPPLKKAGFEFPSNYQYAELEYIFQKCNIITNHVPLTYRSEFATFNLINKDLLEHIMDNSLFIHTSRGEVVDLENLKQISKQKNLVLAIDVWHNEPKFDLDLAGMCMLATPHIAGYSYDGKIKATIAVLEHFQKHFNLNLDFSLLKNELLKTTKRKVKDFETILELSNYIDQHRKFSWDCEEFLQSYRKTKNTEDVFVKFRKKYPNRYECLTF